MRGVWAALVVALLGIASPSRATAQQCGNGIVEAPEDCDDGGTCVGGANAGTACTSESTCLGNGVCVGGLHTGAACASSATCSGGSCVHCVPRGGDGCAANCTFEHDVPYPLVPGQLNGLQVVPGTSGVVIISDFLSIPLPLGGICSGGPNLNRPCTTNANCPGAVCTQSQQVLTVGKERDGKIPAVVKAASVKYPGIPISTLACGCTRGIAAKTCGGTLFELDGVTLSPNCTPGFSFGNPCVGKPPCAFVHGAGNTAAGEIGCNGMDGVNISYEQDSGGSAGACAAPNTCPPIVHLSGHGGPGSAVVANSIAITAALGSCTGSDPSTYGPDGIFCTDDDPPGGIIAASGTLPTVTGVASAVVHNSNGINGSDLGPVTTTGAPFSCSAVAQDSFAGGGLVGALTFVHLDTVGDVAISLQLFAGVGPCGNGVVDPGEECDDHNHTNGDGCSSACRIEPCHTCSGQPSTCMLAGAGTACPGIGLCAVGTCDAAGTCAQAAAADGTPCNDESFCNGADTCSSGSCSVHAGDPCAGGSECADVCNESAHNCFTPNGTQCSGSDPNACKNACLSGACTPGAPVTQSACCGNGIQDGGEQCDDGNLDDGDGCDAACMGETGWTCPIPGQPCQPICGDGLVIGGEQCDDNNLDSGDGCDANCTFTGCGNGIVTSGEQCDDGNLIDGDGCDASCQRECHDTCVTGLPLFPECGTCVTSICAVDPFCCNIFWDDICANETISICGLHCGVCGNGVRERGEQCDDSNLIDGDGCDSNCTFTGCGNGVVTAGEQCDDGNTNDHDACRQDCTFNVCGDGAINVGVEQCDDGNLVDGDGCEANCTFTTGLVPPFTQCPAIDFTAGCGVLLVVTATDAVNVVVDSNQVLRDGDDTLVGVQNNSDHPVSGIDLTSNSVPIFALDGDGLCNLFGAPSSCPFGPTGYEGPGVLFAVSDYFAGTAYFTPPIPPGGSAYFSLEEIISWGQLSAQLTRSPDHFQCYTGRILAAQPPIAAVTLVDGLAQFTAKVRGLRNLCTPTDKNGEDPAAVTHPDHLESYAIAPEKPKLLRHGLPLRNQTVVNQFGTLRVDVIWPNRLLVPTAKSLTQNPDAPVTPAVDHFTCYTVKRTKGAPAFVPIPNVTLVDQFGPGTVTVGRPTRLCVPANKNNEDPGAENHHGRLLCYHVRGGFAPIGRVFTNNQFGPGVLFPRSRGELCVPSVMGP